MAEMASSAFLQVVFQIASNFIIEEMRLENNLQSELGVLKKNVAMISATLNDAEKINPSQPLKIWLDELRDVGYDAIDLLDEHYAELQRRNLVYSPELRHKLSIINPKRVYYRHDMSHKIKEVSLKMNDIFQRRINFGLNVNECPSERNRHEITTSLPPTHIVGRETEKREILNKYLIPNGDMQVGEPKLSIFAIHGMGRIGKTTLAQLIYNEEITLMYFEMRLWVHVSHEFDLETVTRSILESLDEPQSIGINLDTPQRRIQKKLKGKRYLLVLDDFWNEKPHEWEKLIRPLHKGAPGSVIIVTTRNKLVADMVSTFPSYHLKELSEYDCYSLVNQYATRDDRHGRTMLFASSSEIFRNCRGIPEMAIDLGDRLRREHDREKWDEIIQNWGKRCAFPEERNGFISSMRSSYSRLPSILKPCLAYCSIIPMGLQFEKEWIVQLWMGQNFIAKESEQRIEDTGNTYFEWLVERSFFQRTRIGLNRDSYEYSIPNMVHQVAKHTTTEECCVFDLDKSHNLSKTTKHMSIVFTSEGLSHTHDPFTEIYHCKGLYTLLVIGGYLINYPLKLSDNLFNCLGKLRTLDLSYCNLGFLPDNIGRLKHLRYLQLRNSNIQELPESICILYNLQTLGLRNCFLLKKLPKETRCLQQLRHLDLHLDYIRHNINQTTQSCDILKSMPPYMGLLTNLQVLSRFVVSMTSHCGISELKNLNNLQGELSITNLDLVKNPNDAAEANLQAKKHIKRLELLWRRDIEFHQYSNEIIELALENLKPNNNVKELNIMGYPGELLPSWLGSTYLSNVRSIFLSDCTNCLMLPALGNLPLLQDLHIKGMHSLKCINCAFCGSNPISFPSLKKLVFENMLIVEKWSADENCELPHLSELILKDCANFQRLTHNFPSLTKLTIEKLPAFVGLRRYPSLKYLKIVAGDEWIWDSWRCLLSVISLTLSQLSLEIFPANLPKILDSLRYLEISHCDRLTRFPNDWIPPGVTYLCIKDCPMLQELPKGLETLKTLEDLEIQDCKNLEYLPELKHLKSLTRLEISGCHSFVFLPSEGVPNALHFLSINDCPLFSKQFEDLQSPDRIKIKHVFSVWIDQKHFHSTPGGNQGECSN
ncbi:Disease resistance protein RGA2 [Rhynchospora pubera]|uniref:Disease resistance protein RGA2 n=1 Tax=Rhynchospora pubera TaxID=906938 RepID=A0AAV8DYR3_9POAL|nr:Disease resistance protein RGA2 [Rhynchospora pubera]